jgi:OsmC-like protein
VLFVTPLLDWAGPNSASTGAALDQAVTLCAVSTSLGLDVDRGTVHVEGELDFRGTLAVSKEAPVRFRSIRLSFELDTDAGDDDLDTLLRLTQRYCVVYQTLAASSPTLEVGWVRSTA